MTRKTNMPISIIGGMPESFKKFSTAILETHCLDLGRGLTIDANLPVHRNRGREVVSKERADACANVAEDCMRRRLAGHAEINGDGLPPTLGELELTARSRTQQRTDPYYPGVFSACLVEESTSELVLPPPSIRCNTI
jgi:hypothetical protein